MAGCSSDNNLTRSTAKKLLKEKIDGIQSSEIPSGFVVTSGMPSFDEFSGRGIKSPTSSLYKELEKVGIIELKKIGSVIMGEKLIAAFPEKTRKEYVISTEVGENHVVYLPYKNVTFEPNQWNNEHGKNGERAKTGEVFIGNLPQNTYKYEPRAKGKFEWGGEHKTYRARGTSWSSLKEKLPFPNKDLYWGTAFLRIGECYLFPGKECHIEKSQPFYGELNITRKQENYNINRSGQTITVPLKIKKTYSKDVSTVVLAKYHLDTITGMTQPSIEEGQQVSYVEFNVKAEKSPFGEIMLPSFLQKSTIPFKAKLVLYDDGWRVSDKVLPVEIWQ